MSHFIPDYYAILGLEAEVMIPMETDAKEREIYKAYREWSFTFHKEKGDVSPEVRRATASRKKITDAHNILKNPEQRERYERRMLEAKMQREQDEQRSPQGSDVNSSGAASTSADKICAQAARNRRPEQRGKNKSVPEEDSDNRRVLAGSAPERVRKDASAKADLRGMHKSDVPSEKGVSNERVDVKHEQQEHQEHQEQPLSLPSTLETAVDEEKSKGKRKSSSPQRPRERRISVRYDRSFYPAYEELVESDPSVSERREWARKVFQVHRCRRERPALPFEPEDPRFYDLLLDTLLEDAATAANAIASHAAKFNETARLFRRGGLVDPAPIDAARQRTQVLRVRLKENCTQPLRRIEVEALGYSDYAGSDDEAMVTASTAATGARSSDSKLGAIEATRGSTEWQQALLALLFPISDELAEASKKISKMRVLAGGLVRADIAMCGELPHDSYEGMQPDLERKSRDQKSWAARQYLMLLEDWP